MNEQQLEQLVESALQPKVSMTLEFLGSVQHTSAWSDVVQKAKRLIQSGQVTIIHNSPTYVMAHVVGDHGEYNSEISRTNPASSIIEQWSCECPWDQYAFNRTRKWKKLEGRVCSHVLAAYWKGKSTPLDEGSYDPDSGEPRTPFQRYRPYTEEEKADQAGIQPGDQLPMDIDEEQADQGDLEALPRTFAPDEEYQMQGPSYVEQLRQIRERAQGQPVPQQQELVLPKQPQVRTLPPNRYGPKKPQRDQLRLFDLAPPEQSVAPLPPTVSVPGGRPPSPTNPVGIPGALSKYIPMIAVRTSEFHFSQSDDFEDYVQQALRASQRVVVQLRQPATLEQRGGKVPVPGAEPTGYNAEGLPVYRTLDLGWDEQEQRRVRADERPNGAPEQRGLYSEAARGRRGEIVEIEPFLKLVRVQVPLNESGPLHPHYLDGWLSYDDVVLLPEAKSPYWKRR